MFPASGGLKHTTFFRHCKQAPAASDAHAYSMRLLQSFITREKLLCFAVPNFRTTFALETRNCTQNMPYAPRCLLPACAAKLRRAASQGGAPELVTPLTLTLTLGCAERRVTAAHRIW